MNIFSTLLIAVILTTETVCFQEEHHREVGQLEEWSIWSCGQTDDSWCNGKARLRCSKGCGCYISQDVMCDMNPSGTGECDRCGNFDTDWQHEGDCKECRGGSYYGPYNCDCLDEHYGTCCTYNCIVSKYCRNTHCTSSSNHKCLTCYNDTAIQDAYYLATDGECYPKCNWLGHWCFPGTCDHGNNYLHTTCQCIQGFSKNTPDEQNTKCTMDVGPEILSCHLTAESDNDDVASTVIKFGSNMCDNTVDGFVNFLISDMSFEYVAKLELPEEPPEGNDLHVYIPGFAFGIVEYTVEIAKLYSNGNEVIEAVINLPSGNSNCDVATIDRDNPAPTVSCDFKGNYNNLGDLTDGAKVCHRFSAIGSGYVDIEDLVTQKEKRHFDYGDKTATAEKCFIIDYTSPDHCMNTSTTCLSDVLNFGVRIRDTDRLHITFDGWFDPEPVSVVAGASGISMFEFEVRDVIHGGTFLYADSKRLSYYNSTNAPVTISLPTKGYPAMFAIYLNVSDNTQQTPLCTHSRRFVLVDQTSEIVNDSSNPIVVTSAFAETNYLWQNKGPRVKLSWKKHFYNSWHVHTNLLLPIRPEEELSISGPFEQETGELPVIGTPNNDGIVNYHFKYGVHYLLDYTEVKFENVSLPLNETIQLSSYSPRDGDTVNITIRAIDIMNNTLDDNVVVNIDYTAPNISKINLFTEDVGRKPKIFLSWRAVDIHSGLFNLTWVVETLPGASDVGSGHETIADRKVPSCIKRQYCYCPVIEGAGCERNAYIVPMESTDINVVLDYYVTITTFNEARLSTVVQFQIKDVADTVPFTPRDDFTLLAILALCFMVLILIVAGLVLFKRAKVVPVAEDEQKLEEGDLTDCKTCETQTDDHEESGMEDIIEEESGSEESNGEEKNQPSEESTKRYQAYGMEKRSSIMSTGAVSKHVCPNCASKKKKKGKRRGSRRKSSVKPTMQPYMYWPSSDIGY